MSTTPVGFQTNLPGQGPVARVVYCDQDAHVMQFWNKVGFGTYPT
jgi:hypothetical protein